MWKSELLLSLIFALQNSRPRPCFAQVSAKGLKNRFNSYAKAKIYYNMILIVIRPHSSCYNALAALKCQHVVLASVTCRVFTSSRRQHWKFAEPRKQLQATEPEVISKRTPVLKLLVSIQSSSPGHVQLNISVSVFLTLYSESKWQNQPSYFHPSLLL